jgi:hypothetical protein
MAMFLRPNPPRLTDAIKEGLTFWWSIGFHRSEFDVAVVDAERLHLEEI